MKLKHASGDYIVFIQDNNWIYDENLDLGIKLVKEGFTK